MSFLVVANFKSHKTEEEVISWLNDVHPAPGVIIAPSFPHLHLLSKKSFVIAGQDVSPFPVGSYTGAVNAKQLQDLGATYCLVGHSERRRYFHETSTDVANKVHELLEAGITPIICLSKTDIEGQRAALDDSVTSQCLFCYEPPADIGGTETASTEDIKETTNQIKKIFNTTKVMYGGSVNADDLLPLLDLGLAGVLIASASLSSASFNQILVKIPHGKNV